MRYRIWKYYHRGPVSRTEATNAKVPVWTEDTGGKCLQTHILETTPRLATPCWPTFPVAALVVAAGVFLAWLFGAVI